MAFSPFLNIMCVIASCDRLFLHFLLCLSVASRRVDDRRRVLRNEPISFFVHG